ncbi:MAG: hypothetical protein ACRDJW_00400 [Thermomicrobiales bacterium]
MTASTRRARCLVATTILLLAALVVGMAPMADARQATPVATPVVVCGGSPPDDRLVYLTSGKNGAIAIVIAEADGTELDAFPIEGKGIVWTTGYRGRALVQAYGGDDGSRFYLVDVTDVSITPVDLPESVGDDLYVNSPWISQSQGTRWVIIADMRGQRMAVIDLETGSTADLAPLVTGEAEQWGAVTHDDQFVVVYADDQVRVAPVDDLGQVRAIGGGERVENPSLSPDGRFILYTLGDGSISRLMREEGATGEAMVVAASFLPPIRGWFFDSVDRVIVQRGPTLAIKDLATEHERVLLRDAEPIAYAGSLLDGRRLFVAHAWKNAGTWTLIDLESDDVHRYVSGARGFVFNFATAPTSRRWITMVNVVPDGHPGLDDDRLHVSSLDAQTGDLVRLAELSDIADAMIGTGAWTPDGRYAMASVQTEEGASLWLIDNERAEAERLLEGSEVFGYFTPDGCWTVTTVLEETFNELSVATEVAPIHGGAPVATIEGYFVYWIES